MSDLSSIIRYYRYNLYKTAGKDSNGNSAFCKHYQGNDQCDRTEGCFCRKMAEVRGYIDYVIPPQYRDLTIDNARGWIKDKDGKDIPVWKEENQITIQNTLRSYLFGDADSSSFKCREDYIKASKLDNRFAEGANLIIHGKPILSKRDGLPSQPMPTGKTLISCLVLKEVIWRRICATNRADTYALTSYQTLRQDLKLKNDRASDLKEYDWLAIDDIAEPININDFNHQSFLSMFDDFLMARMNDRLPTILVCDFDVLAKDYTNVLGYSFQKMVTAKNTWLISVGEQNGNN